VLPKIISNVDVARQANNEIDRAATIDDLMKEIPVRLELIDQLHDIRNEQPIYSQPAIRAQPNSIRTDPGSVGQGDRLPSS
jgi:hypothetical protein